MKKVRIIFFGTPEFSATILKGLITSSYNIVAVVTQPDRPVGRRQIPTLSPVKLLAQKHNIKVLTTEVLDEKFILQLTTYDLQLSLLAAYAKIIPPKLLSIPKYGFLNLHPSLLPKYRGSSPIEFAILNGEKETGVSIICMDEKVDHGPIVSQAKIKISPTDTKASLTQKLAHLATDLLLSTLSAYLSYCQKTPHSMSLYISRKQSPLHFSRHDRGSKSEKKIFFPPKPQNHQIATFTKILTRDDGFIKPKDLTEALQGKSEESKSTPSSRGKAAQKAAQIERQIRAFSPWPGSWTQVKLKMKNEKLKIRRLKILKAHLKVQPATCNLQPTTKLILDLVQLEGKKPVTFEAFKRGYPDFQLTS